MKSKVAVALGLLLFLAAIVYSPAQTQRAEAGQTVGEQLVYSAADLPEGTLQNLIAADDGLVLSPTAVTGRYLSPPLDGPIEFSALVPTWLADVPESASFTIQLRTGTADNGWSKWFQIHENDDWMLPGDEEMVGQMITVPAVDETHQVFQFALSFGRYEGGASPVLKELHFSFIDASQGLSAAEMVALQAAADQEKPSAGNGNYPKPSVISRDIWCTDPACDYTNGLDYYPVSHLLVHHTVTNNSSSDWAAVVRAIWYFHTFDRGWGDIGYNYLVDMDGVLYEGHLGGDDVIGTHAAGANAGSMALALIGTFTDPNDNPPGIPPPSPMKNSAAELFAWKADQKNIDVYGAGDLPYLSWGLPNLAGHRDVYGTTACPGDQGHLTLPWLRNEVADRIGFVSPHQYIDELGPDFTKSSGSWHVPPSGCGNNGHAFYAWSTTDPGSGVVWGEWRPPVAYSGTYEIEVYAPYCVTGASETDGAKYTITHQNGTDSVTVSHDDNVGTWMSLGTYPLNSGNSNVVRLTNLTTTDNNRGVWFDAIRIRPVEVVSATNVTPAPGSWQTQDVTFTWDVSNQAAVSSIRLQVATDSNFQNLLLDVPLSPTTTTYNHFFDQGYVGLYWRIVVYTSNNVTATSTPTTFDIDTTGPSSLVTYIYELQDGRFRLFWFGEDDISGIASYTIQFRPDGSSTWVNWMVSTTQTYGIFDPPDYGTYWFRSQAIDNAGNSEPTHPDPGDLNTDQALLLTHDIMLPLMEKN